MRMMKGRGVALSTCIDCLAATLEQEHFIKGFEDIDGRLMDGSHCNPHHAFSACWLRPSKPCISVMYAIHIWHVLK